MTTKTNHVRANLSNLFCALVLVFMSACTSTTGEISNLPDTPFKLATFELTDIGATAVGMVLGEQILELDSAGKYLVAETGLEAMVLPNEMRTLIENYETVSARLYQIANFFQEGADATLPFVHAIGAVRITAPIKYPWNVLSVAANYRAHAEGMAAAPSGENPDDVDGVVAAVASTHRASLKSTQPATTRLCLRSPHAPASSIRVSPTLFRQAVTKSTGKGRWQ